MLRYMKGNATKRCERKRQKEPELEGVTGLSAKRWKLRPDERVKVTVKLGLDHPSQLIKISCWDLLPSFLIHVKKKISSLSSHIEKTKSLPEGIQVIQDPAVGGFINIYILQMLYSLQDSYGCVCGHEYCMVFWNTRWGLWYLSVEQGDCFLVASYGRRRFKKSTF